MIIRAGGLLVVAALLAACGATPTSEHPAVVPSPSSHPSTADNRAAARAESQRLLTVLSPPSGGRVVPTSPVADLRDQLEGISPSDSRLAQHAWWTVPMSPNDFAAWLKAQHPSGATLQGVGSTRAPGGPMIDIAELDGTGTSAYAPPILTLAYVADGARVAVRLDTFIAARYARTTYLPTNTSRVTIRTRTTTYGTGHAKTRRRTVSDPAQVRRLVAAANGLNGIVTVPMTFHCPLIWKITTYAVTFTGPSGSFVLTGSSGECGPVVVMRRDGHVVAPSLDPGRRWFPLLGI